MSISKRNSLIIVLYISFTLLFNSINVFAHGEGTVGPFLLNGFVGYQYGIGTNYFVSQGADANLVLAFLNGGYTYKHDFGSNGYFGIGLGSIFQIQYGYAYSQKKDLLRLRSDIPLSIASEKGIWRALSVGLYWEKRFRDPSYSNNYGISLSIGIMNLLWSPAVQN